MKVSELSKQCPNHLLCDDKHCNQTHFRCFSGLCVKQESCQNTQCKLLHFTKKELRTELQMLPINGIYRFNICKYYPCTEQFKRNCLFLHPKWAEKYCYNYFMDYCQDDTHENHKDWKDIRDEVYAKYAQKLKMKCNPEFNLENEVNFFKLNDICQKNLKGICEKKNDECIYRHIYWEYLNQINYLKSETFKSCIEQNNEENYKSLRQYHSQSLLIDDQELKRLKKAFIVQDLVDLIFIMDFTNSMQNWIDICKSSIKGTIETFQRRFPRGTLRVGMVGYRDVNDQQPLTYHNLTTNVDELIAFIAKQKAYGGGDDAEDICLGIQKAMELNISKNPNNILITMLFADAPCHGKQYHNGVCDYLAYSIPKNTLENLMQNYFNLKKQYNFFTCVHITDKTQRMYNIMKQNFEGLNISQPQQYSDFEDLVKFTLQESVNATRIQKYDQFQVKFQRLNNQGESVIEKYEDSVNKFRYSLDDQCEIFQFYDHSNNQTMNVKISKQVIEIINKNEQLSQEITTKLEEEAEKSYKSQIEAIKLSQIFRQLTKNIKGAYPIFISTPILYQLKDAKFYGLSKIFGEYIFDIDEKNQGLSNRLINQISDYTDINFQAFSHFVFEQTYRQFTYIDFKGQKNLLNQPTVLNFQDKEIGDFSAYHKECNIICQELKLPVISLNGRISSQQLINYDEVDQIDIFCQNCGVQAIIKMTDYQSNNIELCKQCQEGQTSLENIFCKCCKEIFQICNKQNTSNEAINKCNNCLQNCNDQEKCFCYYCEMRCPQNLKAIGIEENEISICKKGLAYIKQLQCQNCGEIYDFKNLIDKELFKNRTYFCSKCQ